MAEKFQVPDEQVKEFTKLVVNDQNIAAERMLRQIDQARHRFMYLWKCLRPSFLLFRNHVPVHQADAEIRAIDGPSLINGSLTFWAFKVNQHAIFCLSMCIYSLDIPGVARWYHRPWSNYFCGAQGAVSCARIVAMAHSIISVQTQSYLGSWARPANQSPSCDL